MLYFESIYRHLKLVAQDTTANAHNVLYAWMLADDYSIAILNDPYPPTNPYYGLYFSSISTSYFEYLKTPTPETIWSNANRTLTDFDFEVNATSSVNATEVAEEVWSWNGFISDNVLTNFIDRVWNYTGRYIHGEII